MRKTLAYAALPIAFGALMLAGCNESVNPPPANDAGSSARQQAAPATGQASSSEARSSSDSAPAQTAQGEDQGGDQGAAPSLTPAPAPILAFDFHYGLALPSRQVRPMLEAHQEACERAGPTQCQVVGVSIHDSDQDRASGELTLRATPAWMRLFRDRLDADARDAGGRVLAANTSGQDVAPTIQAASDQESSLQEQRAALIRQIARSDGKTVSGLRDELAQIDAQLSAARSTRQTAEGQAAMATMVIDYQANGLVPSSGAAAPLADAFHDYWETTAWVGAALVRIASVLTPFVILGAPIWWFARRRRRNPAAPAPSSAPGAHQVGS